VSTTTTPIEWTDATWSPVRGCSLVSAGCTNCYAMRQAHRFSAKGGAYEGATRLTGHGPVWNGKVWLVRDQLAAPLHWRRGRRVFVNPMSDLFHEGLQDIEIAAVFAVMAAAPQHTFQVLTKRPARMRAWMEWANARRNDRAYGGGPVHPFQVLCDAAADHYGLPITVRGLYAQRGGGPAPWPLPNVWLGTSVENQATADERIPHLLATPAAVRFLSCEPLLERVTLRLPRTWGRNSDGSWGCNTCCNGDRCDDPSHVDRSRCGVCHGSGVVASIDWVIVGGESGPGARPCDLAWLRAIVEQCAVAAVPCFVKQLGAVAAVAEDTWRAMRGPPLLSALASRRAGDGRVALALLDRKGGDPTEWPADLNVRQFPEVRRG
jgi:protein gp37